LLITTNRYVVQPSYAAENQANIRRVMEALRALHRTDLRYSVFVQDDGKTFQHLLVCASEEAHQVFVSLEAFKAFQAALAASHPEVPPTAATHLTLVDSTRDLLS
jgi:quinol monooxygenase YgiN